MSRRAKIVCTLGPATSSQEQLTALISAGMDVARLNMSHGSQADHLTSYQRVRAGSDITGRAVGILADLQGPKIRLGDFPDGPFRLAAGDEFTITTEPVPGDRNLGSTTYQGLADDVRVGDRILIDDGNVALEVIGVTGDRVRTRTIVGGKISNHKGINLPGVKVSTPALTEKDEPDLRWALATGADMIAMSFVRSPDDAQLARKIINDSGRTGVPLIAKIEKPEAVEFLADIVDAFDGIMVARGDLGVELPLEQVPTVQTLAIKLARERARPVIVATQMLESMINSATPTRAEATDVANAAYEGADALMLSAETASGAYPVEAVTMMGRIIERVERDPRWPELMDAEHSPPEDIDADALVAAARRAADAGSTACLVAFTTTGGTARRLARERPLQPVVALTPTPQVARRLALVWGLEPRAGSDPKTLEDVTDDAVRYAVDLGLAKPGERILILAGTPFGAPGAANLLRFAHAPFKF